MIATLMINRKVAEAFEALDNHNLDQYLKDWAKEAVFTYSGMQPI